MPIKKKVQQIGMEEKVDWAPKIEAKEQTENIRKKLEDIKSREGVIGYILRASTSASVDIKDPSKIIDYAVLSATALESGEDLSSVLELGNISSIILECRDVKIFSMTIGEHRLSIFMEKNVDHNAIHKELT